MSIKYKIDDAKKNKNLIDDKIKLSKVKSKGGLGSDGGRKPSKLKTPTWFADFRNEVMKRFNEQAEFNKQQLEFNKSIREDLNRAIKLNILEH